MGFIHFMRRPETAPIRRSRGGEVLSLPLFQLQAFISGAMPMPSNIKAWEFARSSASATVELLG